MRASSQTNRRLSGCSAFSITPSSQANTTFTELDCPPEPKPGPQAGHLKDPKLAEAHISRASGPIRPGNLGPPLARVCWFRSARQRQSRPLGKSFRDQVAREQGDRSLQRLHVGPRPSGNFSKQKLKPINAEGSAGPRREQPGMVRCRPDGPGARFGARPVRQARVPAIASAAGDSWCGRRATYSTRRRTPRGTRQDPARRSTPGRGAAWLRRRNGRGHQRN